MRKRLWQLHSWIGLFAGLGLLIVGLTGSVLVFREEVDAMLMPESHPVPVSDGRSKLTLDERIAKVREQLPGYEIVSWGTSPDPSKLDQIAIMPLDKPNGEWRWLKADPYTGKALLSGDASAQTFTDWLVHLHVSLLLSDWGTLLVGVFALMLCLLGLSGVYLYRRFWKTLFLLRWRSASRIFFSDLHKMVGITSTVFNLILGFTGAWWNLPALGWIMNADSDAGPGLAVDKKFYSRDISVDSLVSKAKHTMPEMDTSTVYVNFPPRWEGISIQAPVATKNPFRSKYGGDVTFDAETLEVKSTSDIRKESWWTQVEDMMGPLHYGTFGGYTIKVLWCLGGLSPGILATSGFVMWWKRKYPVRRRSVLQRV